MTAAVRLKVASVLAFVSCIGAVALGAELSASPVPTATPRPTLVLPTATPLPTLAPAPCRKEWHGQLLDCCVARAPNPPCNKAACAKRGGVCETNPCGESVCWVPPTGLDDCHREWHGQVINCCVKRAPPPRCEPDACARRGGVCETDPCGHYVCWTGITILPTPTPTPTLLPPPPPPDGTCARTDCPAEAPLMPNWECADGRRGGPACVRGESGRCGWVIVDCR